MGAEEIAKKKAEAIPIKEKDKEGEEEEYEDETKERKALFESVYGPRIMLEEVDEDARKLLSGKRKRKEKKLRKIPVRLIKQKSRKVEPTIYQKIFNMVSKYDSVTEDNIKKAAEKFGYKLEPTNIEFFLELGKAKATIKKYGLPGNICKKPFHVFSFLYFYQDASTITDDRLVWECYYSQLFTKDWKENFSNYADICEYSKIDTVSIVSDKVFKCQKAQTGYVQDYDKSIGIIAPEPVNPDNIDTIGNAIEKGEDGTKTVDCMFRDGTKMTYYQYNQLIMCVGQDSNLAAALDAASKIKIVNTKNKLTTGVKEIKVNDTMGTYLNVHELKPVEFTPSCLFVTPAAPEIKLFVSANLETNQVYSECRKAIRGAKDIKDLPLPPNAIFWDNLSSFIQLLGLMKLIDSDIMNKDLSEMVVKAVEYYQTNKDIFTAWKKTYKLFETIATSFYDAVTTKLTIDGVTKLQSKVTDFLANYTFLKNDESFEKIRYFIMALPLSKLMLNFVMTNGPMELVTSIAKLITILSSGKKLKEEGITTVDEMFRTIGILCTETFFGGTLEMIPKVRSRASFLGIAQGAMNNETLRKNIRYLINAFNTELKDKRDTAVKRMFIDYDQMDEIIEKVIRNSAEILNDKLILDNINLVIDKIKLEKPLLKSLRDDVREMLYNGESPDDIILYGNFLDNTIFTSFVTNFKLLYDTLNKSSKKPVTAASAISSISTNPKARKVPRKYIKAREKKGKIDLNNLSVGKDMVINIRDAVGYIQEANEGLKPQDVSKAIQEANGAFAEFTF